MTLADQWGPTIKQAGLKKEHLALVKLDPRRAVVGIQFFVYYNVPTSVGVPVDELGDTLNNEIGEFGDAVIAASRVVTGKVVQSTFPTATLVSGQLVVGKWVEWHHCEDTFNYDEATILSALTKNLRPHGYKVKKP